MTTSWDSQAVRCSLHESAKVGYHVKNHNFHCLSGLRSLTHFGPGEEYSSQKTYRVHKCVGNAKTTNSKFCFMLFVGEVNDMDKTYQRKCLQSSPSW